jgi:hypothetical protein
MAGPTKKSDTSITEKPGVSKYNIVNKPVAAVGTSRMGNVLEYVKHVGEENNMTWTQISWVSDNGISYHFFRPSPFCRDGYKDELGEMLRKRGWSGCGSLTYKENIPYAEIIDCIAFGNAYEKVYNQLVPEPLKNVPFTISEFLDSVDRAAAKIKKKYKKEYKGEMSLEAVKKFLKAERFELYEIHSA